MQPQLVSASRRPRTVWTEKHSSREELGEGSRGVNRSHRDEDPPQRRWVSKVMSGFIAPVSHNPEGSQGGQRPGGGHEPGSRAARDEIRRRTGAIDYATRPDLCRAGRFPVAIRIGEVRGRRLAVGGSLVP